MGRIKTFTDPAYKGLPVNTSLTMPLRLDILERFYQMMLYLHTYQPRTMFIRFDLHFPEIIPYPDDNAIFCQFVNSLLHNQRAPTEKRKENALNPVLFWCRERKPGVLNHHYHCILLVYAKYSQRYMPHLLTAQGLWERAIKHNSNGLVNFCLEDKWGNPQENGIIWYRSDNETFERCFHWGSYLAKCRDKGNTPFRVHEFDCSSFT